MLHDLQMRIEGPDAERLAAELAEVLEAEFGTPPQRRPIGALQDLNRDADSLAVVAIVLAVPGSLLAAANLAQRLELKTKIDRLLAWVRGKAPDGTPNRIEVLNGDGRAQRLDQAETEDVVDIAVQLSVRVSQRKRR